MPNQNLLIDLQHHFTIVNNLNLEIEQLKQKITENSEIIKTEKLIQPVIERFNALNTEKRQQENILDDLEINQKKLKEKMFDGSISNEKQFAAIEDEIQQNDSKISSYQDSVLSIIDDIEKYENALNQAHQKIEKLKNDKELEDKVNVDLITQYEVTLIEEKLLLDDEIKKNDPLSINLFNKIASQNSAVAVAEINNDRCGACKILVPKSKLAKIKENNDFVICDSCPVILCMKGN